MAKSCPLPFFGAMFLHVLSISLWLDKTCTRAVTVAAEAPGVSVPLSVATTLGVRA